MIDIAKTPDGAYYVVAEYRAKEKQAPFRRWWAETAYGSAQPRSDGRGVEGAAGHDGVGEGEPAHGDGMSSSGGLDPTCGSPAC